MYDDNELSFTNRADHVMKNQKPKQVNIQIISKNSNPYIGYRAVSDYNF